MEKANRAGMSIDELPYLGALDQAPSKVCRSRVSIGVQEATFALKDSRDSLYLLIG
jgi:hypothetical protein